MGLINHNEEDIHLAKSRKETKINNQANVHLIKSRMEIENHNK